MMRWLMIVALAFGAGSPAAAASRVTYATDSQAIVVEIADNGDARITGNKPDQYGLLVGGTFYLVAKHGNAWQVARTADVAAALDRVAPPLFKSLFSAGAAVRPAKLVARKAGTRDVMGFAAEVYTVTGLDAEKPKESVEIVMTHDPAIAPAGKAIAAFMEASMVMFSPLLGRAAADQIVTIRALAALGAPIETPMFRLTAFERADVPPARVALPAPPQTVEEIVKTVKLSPLTQ